MAAIDLDKDQWQQLKAVLTDALKLSAAERVEMLNRRLADDPTLRQRAIEMLRYYDKATRPFGITQTQSGTRGDHSEAVPRAELHPARSLGTTGSSADSVLAGWASYTSPKTSGLGGRSRSISIRQCAAS